MAGGTLPTHQSGSGSVQVCVSKCQICSRKFPAESSDNFEEVTDR